MNNLQLEALLTREIGFLEQLNQVSLTKRDILVRNDVDALEKIVIEEEQLVQKFKEVDDECLPQIQSFLQDNFDKLRLPANIKEMLVEVRQLAVQLQVNNQFNQELMEDALGLLRFMLNCLTDRRETDSDIYSKTGAVVRNPSKTHTSFLVDVKG